MQVVPTPRKECFLTGLNTGINKGQVNCWGVGGIVGIITPGR